MPHRADLSFAGLDDSVYKCIVTESISNESKVETNVTKSCTHLIKNQRLIGLVPLLLKWESNSDNDSTISPISDQPKHTPIKIYFVKPVECVECGENEKQAEKPMSFTQNHKGTVKGEQDQLGTIQQAPTQQNQVVPLRLGSLPSNTVAIPKGKLKSITTRSGIILDGPSFPIPPPFINPKEDERVEETLTDQDLVEYTIKDKLLELANTPLNENCSAVFLKKLPEELKDPGKFLIPCGFNELKCKALANLGASINLMPLSVWKKLGLPGLISTHMTLVLANRAICTPAGIARDVFVPVGKFTFPAHFVIVDYESDPRVPLILGRPFLRTARALIDVHREEMILRDDNIFDPEGGNVLPEKLLDLDSTKDLHPPHHVRKDDLSSDIESDLKEIEYLLHHDPIKDIDSILKDSVDQSNLIDLNDNLVDSMLEMFTDEHALDYSSPPLYDEYGEKIKEFKLLIDKLDLPSDFLPSSEYDFIFSEDFSKVDALPLTNNEDKVINPGILIQENLFEVITHVAPEKNEKKLAISHASLMLEDFNPPFY
nr:reverse transcriptase domain-containing protein [Tanacetum cinerariifolium]